MPSMNSRGDVLMRGTQGASINGTRIAPDTAGGDLGDIFAIYQRGGPPFSLETRHLQTQARSTVATRGANEIKAAGGHWAAYLAGYGGFTSWGLHLPTAGLVALAADQTLAVVDAGSGLDLELLLADGSVVALGGNVLPGGMVLRDKDTALWVDYAWKLHVRGLPMPVLQGFPHALLRLGSADWLLQTLKGRLLLHPLAETRGYDLGGGNNLHRPCAAFVNGAFKVAWSNGQGEEPSDLRSIIVSPNELRSNLPLVQPPVPSPLAPLPSTIAKVGRPAVWSYWKPVAPLGPCNAILIEQSADLALANAHPTLPLIVLRQVLIVAWPYWARVLAVMIHEEGGQAAIEAQARLARLAMAGAGVPLRDVMTYTGAKLYPSAQGVDIHGIQAYLPADTPNPAVAIGKLIRAARAQFGPQQRMVLHGQAYDRRTYNDPTRRPAHTAEGWTDLEGLKAIQCIYPAAVLVDSRIVGCIWFNDGQRQGGTRDYPELKPYHVRCVAVTPGPPAVPGPPPPPPPPTDPNPPEPEEPPVPTKCTIHPARKFDDVYPVVLAIDAWATEHLRPLQAGEYFQIASMFLIDGATNQKAFEWTKGHLGITAPIPADPQSPSPL